MVHGQGKMNTNNRERRRAGSNYFQLDSDRKRMNSAHHNRDSFSRSLTIMDVCNPRTNEVQNQRLGGGMQGDFDDEVSIDFCCDVLYNKFGFQSGSVDNQREHVLLLLANGKARSRKSDKKGQHVEDLHRKLISNYVEWCKFLRIKMVSYQGILQGDLKSTLHMEIMLYLLIWGEAANLRHMPECVCYLYHQMMKMLNRDIHGQERHPEGWFLKRVVRPVWEEASNMKRKNSLDKHLEHVRVRNYDDINEYFWKRHCVNIDITKIGSELTKKHGKTYYEHRSIFTLVLNYYRIFQFNFMFLIGLIVLSFAVAISPGGGMTGLAQFQSIGQVVQPYTQRDLKLALVSLVFSHAAMAFLKCVLEAAHGWHLLVARESLSTSSRSFTYGGALIVRMLWNGFFAGIFGLMIYHPFTLQRDTPLLENATTAAFAFLTPGTLVLLVHAFAPQAIVGSFASKFIREGETCYVGRHMAPPLSGQLRYILFWLTLWSLKAVVSYVILVRPLMLPSLAIYSMNLNYSSTVVSFHNIGLIMSLWMPVVFIFNYDTQIYFTAFQALLGGLMGLRMKTGEIHGIKNLTKAFRMAPQFFDQKVVTRLARSNDANGGSESYQSQMMLRFVVVWNEVVNSFREGDLVDDKEAAILQYDIQSSGDVFEPVFLSAGKIAETIKHIKKLLNEGKGDSQLQVFIVENDSLSAARSFYAACMYVLEALLGSDDADLLEALRSIEHTASRGEFMRAFDVRNLELLRAVTMEFLEAVMDLPDPEVKSSHLSNSKVHTMGVVKNFVGRVENLFNGLRAFCGNKPGTFKNSFLYSCKCKLSIGC
jgi:callose synthase